jgi:hypothetical protein
MRQVSAFDAANTDTDVDATATWRALQDHVLRASELLVGERTAHPQEAAQILTVVEDLLAGVARRASLDGEQARRMLALRDELGGHLLAAAALEVIELGDLAVGVLRRATLALDVGLDELATDEQISMTVGSANS